MVRNTPSDIKINAANELLVSRRWIPTRDRSFTRFDTVRIRFGQASAHQLINGLRSLGHSGRGRHRRTCCDGNRLSGFCDRLILRGKTAESKLMEGTVRRLEDNVITFDFNEGSVHLAALDVGPHAGFRKGGTDAETSGKKACEQCLGGVHGY